MIKKVKIRPKKSIKTSIENINKANITLYDKVEPYLIDNKIEFKDFIGEELSKYLTLTEKELDLINVINKLSDYELNILYEFISNIIPIWWQKEDVIAKTYPDDIIKTQSLIDKAQQQQQLNTDKLEKNIKKYSSIKKSNTQIAIKTNEQIKKLTAKIHEQNKILQELKDRLISFEYTYKSSPAERLLELYRWRYKHNELSTLIYQYNYMSNENLDSILIDDSYTRTNKAKFEDYIKYAKLFDVSIHWLLCFDEYCIYTNNSIAENIFDLYKLSNLRTKQCIKTFIQHLNIR